VDNHRNLNRPLVPRGLNVLHLWRPDPPPLGDRARGADHQTDQKGVKRELPLSLKNCQRLS